MKWFCQMRSYCPYKNLSLNTLISSPIAPLDAPLNLSTISPRLDF